VIQNDHVLAICRALGIISKIITEPYERSADENTPALSMGNVYNRLINILALSTENPDLHLECSLNFEYNRSKKEPKK
jgi:hypothetical protein